MKRSQTTTPDRRSSLLSTKSAAIPADLKNRLVKVESNQLLNVTKSINPKKILDLKNHPANRASSKAPGSVRMQNTKSSGSIPREFQDQKENTRLSGQSRLKRARTMLSGTLKQISIDEEEE